MSGGDASAGTAARYERSVAANPPDVPTGIDPQGAG